MRCEMSRRGEAFPQSRAVECLSLPRTTQKSEPHPEWIFRALLPGMTSEVALDRAASDVEHQVWTHSMAVCLLLEAIQPRLRAAFVNQAARCTAYPNAADDFIVNADR